VCVFYVNHPPLTFVSALCAIISTGCDGSGNVSSIRSIHNSIMGCPRARAERLGEPPIPLQLPQPTHADSPPPRTVSPSVKFAQQSPWSPASPRREQKPEKTDSLLQFGDLTINVDVPILRREMSSVASPVASAPRAAVSPSMAARVNTPAADGVAIPRFNEVDGYDAAGNRGSKFQRSAGFIASTTAPISRKSLV
jgi:hypothetical protein